MNEQVSTFLPVEIGNKKYLFFIVTWNDYVTQVGEELEKQFSAFGEDLGPTGKVVKSYKSATHKSFDEVMGKTWPEEIVTKFKTVQEPFMLVIDESFEDFDPVINQWGIVWFSNFFQNPGAIYRLFGLLARKVREDDDIFEFLNTIAKKEKLKKFGKYFQLNNPELFGIAIDVEAIIEDLMG